MLGAITGDIIGSRFEFNGIKSTAFDLFGRGCRFTDDLAMTLPVAEWLLEDSDHICCPFSKMSSSVWLKTLRIAVAGNSSVGVGEGNLQIKKEGVSWWRRLEYFFSLNVSIQ